MKNLITVLLLFCFQFTFAQESIRPWMGMYIEDHAKGVFVKQALDDTPAKKAGLKSGDIILSVNKIETKTSSILVETVISIGVGNIAKVRYLEDGKTEKQVSMELIAKPGALEVIEKSLLNKKAPAFKAKVLSGLKEKTFDLTKNKGKVIVIEFWATWCGACTAAQPILAEFAKKNPDIKILAISDEETRLLKKYIGKAKKEKRTNDSVIYLKSEGKDIAKNYFIPALPLFIVLDKNLVVKSISVGIGPKLEKQLEYAKSLK